MTTTPHDPLHHDPKPATIGLDDRGHGDAGPASDRFASYSDAPANGSTGIADLIKNLRDESLHLIRQEVNLAKTEAAEKVRFFAGESGKLAAGGAILAIGGLGLLSGVAFLVGGLLDWVIPNLNASAANGLGFLVVGAIAAIVGYVMYAAARKRIASEPLIPERTVRSLQDDKAWAKAKGGEAAAATRHAVGR